MMNEALTSLIENIKADYFRWTSHNGTRELSEVNKRMIEEFNSSVRFEEGKKYIKVISGSSVWGFIVKSGGGKFRAGDILKAASWKAPAMNSARGNILDGGYTIQWTGPLYLK